MKTSNMISVEKNFRQQILVNVGVAQSCRLQENVLLDHRLLLFHCRKLLYLKNADRWPHKILRVYLLQGAVLDCFDVP